MDRKQAHKQVLKEVMSDLNPGDNLSIVFLGDRAEQSGDFTVVRVRKGRGKGGTRLLELKTPSGELLTTGTPESDHILQLITADGVVHGYETEALVPPTFVTDAGKAAFFKESFKSLIEHCVPMPKESYLDASNQPVPAERDTRSRFVPAPGTEVHIQVESTYAPIAGTFYLKKVELKRGRYGKVLLTMLNPQDNSTVVLDSFQHSVAITDFAVQTN